MKYLVPLIVGAWVFTAAAALAATVLNTDARQIAENIRCRGDQPCYTHGAHCIDERSF